MDAADTKSEPDELQMPEPIPDTPENIMKAILATPPRRPEDWKFVEESEEGEDEA